MREPDFYAGLTCAVFILIGFALMIAAYFWHDWMLFALGAALMWAAVKGAE